MLDDLSEAMLHYQTIGAGYPVIFLHGFLESNTMWDYLPLEELDCLVNCIELPGHGNSPICEVLPPSINCMTQKVLEVVDFLGLKQFAVVGHSMGGYVALDLKKKCSKVEKVVLLNSNTWSDSPQKVSDRQRVASIVYNAKTLFLKESIPNLFLDPKESKREVEALVQEAESISADAIAYASLAMSTRQDYSNMVASNPNDFHIVQGAGDKIVSREAMEQLYRLHPHYYLIEGAGHMAHIEKPTAVMEILKGIFKE